MASAEDTTMNATDSTATSKTNNNRNNNSMMMETPPSSPPRSKSQNDSNASNNASNTTSATTTHTPPIPSSSNIYHKNPGHTRNSTPSTPLSTSSPITPSEGGGSDPSSGPGQGRLFTPSRSDGGTGSAGNPPRGLYPHYPGTTTAMASSGGVRHGYGAQGAMTMADLTPVISNSNIQYVDHHPPTAEDAGGRRSLSVGGMRLNRPDMGGVGGADDGRLAGFVVVSPAMMRNGTTGEDDEDGLDDSPENHTGDGNATGNNDGRPTLLRRRSAGLQQRKLPPPRSTIPPAKRSSADAGMLQRMPSAGHGSGAGPNAMTPMVPQLMTETEDGAAAAGPGTLLGEGFSMPVGGLYSDESSVENNNAVPFRQDSTGGVGNGILPPSVVRRRSSRNPIVMEGTLQQDLPPSSLAPIELKPDRKFFSFSGTSQYKRAIAVPAHGTVADDDDDEDDMCLYGAAAHRPSHFRSNLATIQSPSRGPRQRPPTSPNKSCSHPPHLHQNQYQPSSRAVHGVSQMADTKDIDAIFKVSRTPPGPPTDHRAVVSPATPRPGDVAMTIDGEEREATDPSDFLRNPVAMEDRQWSIPSIRLANHLKTDLDSSYQSFRTLSDDEYTEEGASFDDSYSYLADGDDASLSSKGSHEPGERRRMMMTDIVRRTSSGGPPQILIPSDTFSPMEGTSSTSYQDRQRQVLRDGIQAMESTTSSLERKLHHIAIENTATIGIDRTDPYANPILSIHRAETFNDSDLGDEMMADLSLSIDDAAVDYYTEEQRDRRTTRARRSSRHRRSSRRRRRGDTESGSAAFEWLRDLQERPTNGLLIAEAASSKFLTGATSGKVGDVGGDGGSGNQGSSLANSEDVTKALGMPHPLCRSTTIDPQYVHRSGFGFTGGSGHGKNDVLGGTNNSIALTSSGSS